MSFKMACLYNSFNAFSFSFPFFRVARDHLRVTTWYLWTNEKQVFLLSFECNACAIGVTGSFCACFGRFKKVWSPFRKKRNLFLGLAPWAEFANMSTAKGSKPFMEGKSRRFSAPTRGRAVRRPEDVVRDVRGLKLRQRVSLVLNDKVLRDELEGLVQNYVSNGPKTSGEGIRTYQDFLIPSSTYYGGGMSAVVAPIADIRGSDTLNYSKQERLLRCKLASTYRLVDLFGWNTSIYNFITVSMN